MMNIIRNSIKKISMAMAGIFSSFILLSGVQASAVVKKAPTPSQVLIATNYVVAAEKYVKPNIFTVKWAQLSVYAAKSQVMKVKYKGTQKLLINRLNIVQGKINARAAAVTAALNKLDADNLAKLNTATAKVNALEASAGKDLTLLDNLVNSEALISPATADVAKIAVSASRTSLENRIKVVTDKITTARTAFNAKSKETHDADALQAVILSAQKLYDGATEGTVDGNYTVGSKDILQAAIQAAGNVVDNAGATSQGAIDIAVTTLNTAIATFNSGLVVTHDAGDLQTAIQAAQDLIAAATEGTADGNYAVGSKDILQGAVQAAGAVVARAGTTSQEDIDMAVTTLNTAIATFNSGKVVTHDATALQAAIQTAQDLIAGATEGTADGNYAVGSKDILQGAIQAAGAVVARVGTTSQVDIDMAVNTLNTAIATFNSGKVVTHDATALQAAIQTAQGLIDGATEGTSDGNYAVGSKDILQGAIQAAGAVAASAGTTSQSAIDLAVTTLNTAIATFNTGKVVTHDTAALQVAIQAAQSLVDAATEGTATGNYAVGSKDILQTAITTAQLVVTNGGATTQTAINNALTTLNSAVATFNSGLVS